jgi:hypothetical protein
VWEGLYLARVFLVGVDALHLNVLNIPGEIIGHALRTNIFADSARSRLAEVLGSPLMLLMVRRFRFLLYFRITRLAHTYTYQRK